MKAFVIKSTGSFYKVKDLNGEFYECRLRGALRQKKSDLTNPVAVGDWVEVEQVNNEYHISNIYPRDNYVLRKSNNLSKRAQIIASNIHQVLLIVTISQPRTSFGFIDRYLAICEIYGINAFILFNKLDAYNKEELLLLDEYQSVYNQIGYKTIVGSVFNEETIHEIKELIFNKITLLAGHSGVGKSTWLNLLIPNSGQKTGEISEAHQKGKHTTTFAEMFFINEQTGIIDTPGIKDFGIVETEKSEVQNGFKEFIKYRQFCRFKNCTHIEEPNCAILKALNDGSVSESRYYTYLSIFEEIQ